MATELVELRPGQWFRVVEGRIGGRATPEEVAAWQAGPDQAGGSSTAPTPTALDLDVDLAGPGGSPARVLEVPLRPAFQRRGRRVSADGAPPKTAAQPAAAKGRPPARAVEMAPPAQPAVRPGGKRSDKPPARSRLDRPGPPPVEPTARTQAQPQAASAAPEPAPAKQGAASAVNEAPASFWWVWNAQRQPVEAFLREWTRRYRDKFGHEVTAILCHEEDLPAAQACGLEAGTSPLLQPGHFYLSHGRGPG